MVQTPSQMIPLGTKAVEFSLTDTVSGENFTLDSFESTDGLLVIFICNHCPFVKHINDELVRLGNDYSNSSLSIVAISSNDAETYPEDSPEKMKEYANTLGYPFPYLYDPTQEVAKSFGATCTPDFFLYNKERELFYRGQLDDSRPGNQQAVNGTDMRNAIDALLDGKPAPENQIPSIGCNIKWRAT